MQGTFENSDGYQNPKIVSERSSHSLGDRDTDSNPNKDQQEIPRKEQNSAQSKKEKDILNTEGGTSVKSSKSKLSLQQAREAEEEAEEVKLRKKSWFGTKDAKFYIKQPNDKDGKRVRNKVIIGDACSLFIFDSSFEIRQLIVQLVDWSWFDQFIMSIILINSIMLCLTDYNERILGPDYWSEKNFYLDKIDLAFTVIFILECSCKIIAKGFIFHRNSYLRDVWNWLDFFVVCISVLNFLPSVNSGGLKALRTFRILRPLRTVNRLPKMKALIETLFASLPGLLGVLIFLGLTFVLFAIFGIQSFAGSQYQFCRLTEEPKLGYNNVTGELNFYDWPRVTTFDWLCTTDKDCKKLIGIFGSDPPLDPTNSTTVYKCGASIKYNIKAGGKNNIDNVNQNSAILYDLVNFNNVANAMLTIFQVLSLENWTDGMMYNYMDSNNTYISALYFITLVIFGAFFIMNLVLAQIIESYNKQEEATGGVKAKNIYKKKDVINDTESEENGEQSKSKIDSDKNKSFSISIEKKKSLRNKYSSNKSIRSPHQNEQQIKMIKSKDLSKSRDICKAQDDSFEEEFEIEVTDEDAWVDEDEAERIERKRSEQNALYGFFYVMVTHWAFNFFITIMIILNTVSLASDDFPQTYKKEKFLKVCNIFFTWLFFGEMLLKLIGLGPKNYVRDFYNKFDAFIVLISIIDFAISQSLGDNVGPAAGALKAFRALRLLRMIKLARRWKALQEILAKTIASLESIAIFTMLLILFMYIFALLGMQLFAKRSMQNIDGEFIMHNEIIETYKLEVLIPTRLSFDNIYLSMNTIFVIIMGDGWNVVMYENTIGTGATWAPYAIFFVILFTLGNKIMLSLFTAILLQNFDDDGEGDEPKEEDDGKPKPNIFLRIFNIQNARIFANGLMDVFGKRQTHKEAKQLQKAIQDQAHSSGSEIVSPSPLPIKEDNDGISQFPNPIIQVEQFPEDQISNTSKKSNKHSSDSSSQKDAVFNEYQTQTGKRSGLVSIQKMKERSPEKRMAEIDESPYKEQDGGSPDKSVSGEALIGAGGLFPKKKSPKSYMDKGMSELIPSASKSTKTLLFQNSLEDGDNSQTKMSLNFKRSQSEKQEVPADQKLIKSKNKDLLQSLHVHYQIQKERGLEKAETLADSDVELVGRSLYIWKPDTCCSCRQKMLKFITNKWFENVILTLIAISTINLAFESPLDDPKSKKLRNLMYIDYFMTSCFTIEMLCKIFTYGFVLNGKTSYLRDGWSILDFVIVFSALMGLNPNTGKNLKVLKTLRVLRVLRPLRMVSRNRGLKIALTALFKSIPDILNLQMIVLFFLFLFGILHTTLFGGLFWTCSFDHLPLSYQQTQVLIKTKFDCINYGGEWINADYNFDNIWSSMITLFSIQSTEGWNDPVMWSETDATEIDYMPKQFTKSYFILFAIFVEIITNLLFLNLFVGVVVETFNEQKSELVGLKKLTKRKILYLNVQIMGYEAKPVVKLTTSENYTRIRNWTIKVVLHKAFEMFIMICIIGNTVVLCLMWYGQSKLVDQTTNRINYFFMAVFTIEAVFKLIAMHKTYFYEAWNIFDFIVVVATFVILIIGFLKLGDFAIQATILRSLRIGRLLKIMRGAKRIQVIFNTLTEAAPSMGSLGMLLILLMFMYAIIGMKLFGFANVSDQSTVHYHCNFKNFFEAFLLLCRSSTGEAWDSIMFDMSRQKSILFQCQDSQDYDDLIANNMKTNKCGSGLASFGYFISYVIIVMQIFLNLFIAIIIDSFISQSDASESPVQKSDLEIFVEQWKQIDIMASGHIKCRQLEQFVRLLMDANCGLLPPMLLPDYEHKMNAYDEERAIFKYIASLNVRIYKDYSQEKVQDILNVTFIDLVCGFVKSAFKRHFIKEKKKKDEAYKKAHMNDEMYQKEQLELASKRGEMVIRALTNIKKDQDEELKLNFPTLDGKIVDEELDQDFEDFEGGLTYMDRQIDMYKDLRKKARKANEKLVFYRKWNKTSHRQEHLERGFANYLKSVEVQRENIRSARIGTPKQDFEVVVEVLTFEQYEKDIFEIQFSTHCFGFVRIFEQIWFDRKARRAAQQSESPIRNNFFRSTLKPSEERNDSSNVRVDSQNSQDEEYVKKSKKNQVVPNQFLPAIDELDGEDNASAVQEGRTTWLQKADEEYGKIEDEDFVKNLLDSNAEIKPKDPQEDK